MTLINASNAGLWFCGLIFAAFIAEHLAKLYLRHQTKINRWCASIATASARFAVAVQAGWSRGGLG